MKDSLRVALLGNGRLPVRLFPECGDAYAEFWNGNDNSYVLCKQCEQEMEIVDDRLPARRATKRFVERFSGLDGEFIGIDHALEGCNASASICCQSGLVADPVEHVCCLSVRRTLFAPRYSLLASAIRCTLYAYD